MSHVNVASDIQTTRNFSLQLLAKFIMIRSRILQLTSVRGISSTIPRPFLGNFFGKKDQKQQEIIEKQEDYEVDPSAKITILNEENAPGSKPFDRLTDLPEFQINQWKSKVVSADKLEETYHGNSSLVDILNNSYKELTQKEISEEQYSSINLHDLQFRFKYAKLIQQSLGFDINDFVLSKAHTLLDLHTGLQLIVLKRYTFERNPNAIVLRREDFTSPNIYLNEELSELEQAEKLQKLAEEAKAAVN